jgi:hypothetical protein
MITPSHLVYNLGFFQRYIGNDKMLFLAVALGAFLPDLPVWLFGIIGTLAQVPFETLWRDLYFAEPYTSIFQASHSFVVAGSILLIGLVIRLRWLILFSVSCLLHFLFDFLLHSEDAYQHFWPLSSWQFFSPISYWDPNYFGQIVGLIEILLGSIILIFLYKKISRPLYKKLLVIGGAIYLLLPLSGLIIFSLF